MVRVASKTPDWVPPKDFDGKVKHYKIKRRDTLTHIAKRHGLSVGTLAAFNQLNNPNSLRRGQKIKIPIYEPPEKTNSTKTLIQIAKKLEVKVSQPELKKVQKGPETDNNASQENSESGVAYVSAEPALFNKKPSGIHSCKVCC